LNTSGWGKRHPAIADRGQPRARGIGESNRRTTISEKREPRMREDRTGRNPERSAAPEPFPIQLNPKALVWSYRIF
jgi:hypothetical protein